MEADPSGVLTGTHYLDGDHAAAEGGLAAGCRFFAGYPITPSTEIAERVARRFPRMGGVFLQMEDEMGAMACVLGGVWGGQKAMTCTSGPGFSLMMENLGLGVMMEKADVMQARWGSHGDYEIIALAPNSPQEAFNLTIDAFNLSERYRVPTLVMMDECVGHMTEKVIIPPAEEIEIQPRRLTQAKPADYLPYHPGDDLVPEMCIAGEGYRIHSTGLTHDERGYPAMTAEVQKTLVNRLVDKIMVHSDEIIRVEETRMEGAEAVLISYGITSRVARAALQKAWDEGRAVGELRLVTLWPFPEEKIRSLARSVRGFVVPEINLGQMSLEVERCAGGQARTIQVPHAGGWVHDPEQIYEALVEVTS
jgi:2-oxoglutarate ferredoxin oxidoreductase subunit alpha